MADLQKTVEIVFGGKDELSGKLGNIEKGMDNLDKSVAKATEPLANAGESVLKLSAALSALVVGGMALAIKSAGEFGGQFAEITTLFDATGQDVDKFRKNILNYSVDSVKSIEDINKSIYAAISAGIDYKDSLDFLNVAEKLSVAGKADLEATTKVLVSTLNAYGAGVDQAEKYSDVFFKTVQVGQTTMPELAASMAQVTSIATAGGVPIETLTAAIATLTAKGMPTSQAITSIRGALIAMVKPTGEAAEMARTLGIDFSASALASKGFDGVLREVMTATGGNVDMIAKLFTGVEGLGAALSLGADDASLFAKNIEAMANATGATAAGYDKMAQEFEQVNQRMANAFKVTMISIGEELMPAYGSIVQELGEMFKGIKVSLDAGAFDGVFAAFDAIGREIGKLIKNVAGSMSEVDMTKLARALQDIAISFTGSFDEIDTKKIGGAIQTVVDSFASLISMNKGIIEVFGLVASAAYSAVNAFNNLDGKTKELLGNLMGFSMAYKYFGPLSLVILALGSDMETAGRIFAFVFSAIENGVNVLKVGFYGIGVVIWEMIVAMNKLADLVPGIDMSKDVANSEKSLRSWKESLSGAVDDLCLSAAKVVDAWQGTGEATGEATKKVSEYQKAVDKIETAKTTEVTVKTDPANLAEEGKKLEAAAPKEKNVDVKLDAEKVKKDADVIKTMVEWKAKIDIAEIEAGVEKMKTMFSSIDAGIQSTGNVLSSLFSSLNSTSAWNADIIEDAIEKEQKFRAQEFELQKKLIEMQLEMNQLKIDRMRDGNFALQIQADGLEPELEAFMWKIIKKVQVRANESSAEFLLGMG